MIGISSPSFSFLDFEEMLEKIRKEFELWEVVAELDHDLPAIEEGVKYAMDSYGMKFQVHAPIADLNIGSPSDRMRARALEELLMIMQTCERLSIQMITIHPGAAVAYGEDVKSRVREATRASIKIIDRAIEGMSLKVALENMPPGTWSICYDIDELKSMVEGTRIGICFDTGHAHVAGTIDGFLREREMILNVHLHNNDKTSDQHLALDKGTIDLKPIVGTLSRKYRGNYIIEANNLREGIESKRILEGWLA
jgi:sugar phosphate isomerase/epimerase